MLYEKRKKMRRYFNVSITTFLLSPHRGYGSRTQYYIIPSTTPHSFNHLLVIAAVPRKGRDEEAKAHSPNLSTLDK